MNGWKAVHTSQHGTKHCLCFAVHSRNCNIFCFYMAVWLCARLIFYSDIRQSIYSNPFLITEQKSISCSELMLQQMLSTQPNRETHPIYPFAGAGIPKLKIDQKSQQSKTKNRSGIPATHSAQPGFQN